MAIQITIIGLGQIGTSIGLALAKHTATVKRVGFDKALEVQNKAKSLGALDATHFNLPAAMEGADVVLLCIPLDQMEETLKLIAPDLREHAVVMDFSSQKALVHKWFMQHVAAGRHYIGLVPSINPAFMEQNRAGIESARADLFEKASFGIAAPAGTPAEALKLADDLATLVGAQSIFLDMLEADGMLMTAHLLPQAMAAALLNATIDQPGWTEARRFAGKPYAQASAALGNDSQHALALGLLNNPITALNALDNAIGALTHIRAAVQSGNQADLEKRLEVAFNDREKWLNERERAEWLVKDEKSGMPQATDALKRIFLGGRSADKKDKKK